MHIVDLESVSSSTVRTHLWCNISKNILIWNWCKEYWILLGYIHLKMMLLFPPQSVSGGLRQGCLERHRIYWSIVAFLATLMQDWISSELGFSWYIYIQWVNIVMYLKSGAYFKFRRVFLYECIKWWHNEREKK